MSKHSIFLRIYAGLVILVVLVTIFGYLLVQIVNYQRIQEYRESLTDGMAYVISEAISQQQTTQQKQDWIFYASELLQFPVSYIDANKVELSRAERSRMSERKAAVRYDAKRSITTVIIALKDDPNHYIYAEINELGELQMKQLPVLIWEYLAYYPGQEQEYLDKIRHYFSYNLNIRKISDLKLDSDQIGRLNSEQTIIVVDSASSRGTTITLLAPMSRSTGQVLVIGPIPVFNWMPFQLAAGITLLSMFILSLGIYGLILPMQRKLKQVNTALDEMQKGDMSVRVPVEGYDELATLASSYNSMSDHIQRLIEAQRELMRAVSHELRTPVARIRFGMEMLVDEDDYEYRQQQVDMIDKDIEALNTLIDEIMTYAKLEQGMPSIDFEEVRLAEVLEQVARETTALKTEKNIKLDLPYTNLEVDAERRYLHRVVQNLVGNAIRYCDDTVLISGGINASGHAYISVEDDGPGIPEEDRERVFEAFARLDDSRTRASGGYGLGLSIVSRIAYWFGGVVKVDQSPALGGARFVMEWPAKRSKKKKIVPTQALNSEV